MKASFVSVNISDASKTTAARSGKRRRSAAASAVEVRRTIVSAAPDWSPVESPPQPRPPDSTKRLAVERNRNVVVRDECAGLLKDRLPRRRRPTIDPIASNMAGKLALEEGFVMPTHWQVHPVWSPGSLPPAPLIHPAFRDVSWRCALKCPPKATRIFREFPTRSSMDHHKT